MTYRTMNGVLYRRLIDYGIRNLALHREEINDLNVFPVPDGDTGTNMVTTLKIGYSAIEGVSGSLSEYATRFTQSVIYGARGNSGVIISQFFKGFSESLSRLEDEASLKDFELAVGRGVKTAYKAVARPQEGTMLTVLRESSEYLTRSGVCDNEESSLSDALGALILRAKLSLKNTPELLPVLKQAGVVDSGGCGVVYIFEGMLKCLRGESLEIVETEERGTYIDYSLFNRHSRFDYGYCTEFLLQLLDSFDDFDSQSFICELEKYGDSIVCSPEGDKVKVHIHTHTPEKIISYAHQYGEFLSMKIENMSVQHSSTDTQSGAVRAVASKDDSPFAVIAVAPTTSLLKQLEDMGVDIVICTNSGIAPSTSDFIEAYKAAGEKKIIVFPNNPNLKMTATQARELYANGSKDVAESIFVIDSRSVADCYAALAIIDFTEEDLPSVCEEISQTIKNIYTIRLTEAARDAVFGEVHIKKHDVLAMHGMELIAAESSRADLAIKLIKDILDEEERDTLTLFVGAAAESDEIDLILSFVKDNYIYTETDLVMTGEASGDILLSFE